MALQKVARKKSNAANASTSSPTPRLALSIPQFCEAHNISAGMFYKMKKKGLTPREMKCGTRTLITFEAAADWRAERELETLTQAAKVKPAPPTPPAVTPLPVRPAIHKNKPARSVRRREEANA